MQNKIYFVIFQNEYKIEKQKLRNSVPATWNPKLSKGRRLGKK